MNTPPMKMSRLAPYFVMTLAGGFLAFLVFTASVFAAKVHIPANKIAFNDIGTQLETYLKIAGLGKGDVTVQIEAEGTADVTVLNPGNNDPPGQQVGIVASGSETIPSNQIKNGTVNLVLTTEPLDEDDVAADLPNPNWEIDINDVVFEEVTVTVIQNGQVVFQRTYTL